MIDDVICTLAGISRQLDHFELAALDIVLHRPTEQQSHTQFVSHRLFHAVGCATILWVGVDLPSFLAYCLNAISAFRQ